MEDKLKEYIDAKIKEEVYNIIAYIFLFIMIIAPHLLLRYC